MFTTRNYLLTRNKNLRNILQIAFLFSFLPIVLNAQLKCPDIEFETSVIAGKGENLPFWLLSNRNGALTNDLNQALSRFSIKQELDKDKVFSIAYGLSAIGRVNNNSDLYFEEFYVDLKYHFLRLELGSKRKTYGVQDQSLSSGGILWSGNARPIPEISLNTLDYIDVPYTSGFLQFNGGMSHGWLDDYPGIKNVWLHHKWLMIKGGGNSPVHLTAGLHHFAQWGGYSDKYGQLATDLETMWEIFIANNANENSPLHEQLNAPGNHLGSYNLKIDYTLKDSEFGIYWESIFEDNSGRKLRNFPDGLYGLSIKSTKTQGFLNQFIFEYLATDNQSGLPTIDTINNIPTTGGDNYFKNGIYLMGWSTHLMTIGTPLISSPIYTETEVDQGVFVNNRVRALHFGLGGCHKSMDYKFLYTHSLNKGTYSSGFDPPNHDNSLLIALSFEDVWMEGSSFQLDFGMDIGEFYGNNYGLMLSWKKRVGGNQTK